MSLKGFHVVFIVLSILVTLLFAWWTLATSPGQASGSLIRGIGIGSGILGIILTGYGVWFVQTKNEKIIV